MIDQRARGGRLGLGLGGVVQRPEGALGGGDKAAGVFAPLKPPLDRIQRQLKAAFDPDGLFNRGRLYADL